MLFELNNCINTHSDRLLLHCSTITRVQLIFGGNLIFLGFCFIIIVLILGTVYNIYGIRKGVFEMTNRLEVLGLQTKVTKAPPNKQNHKRNSKPKHT